MDDLHPDRREEDDVHHAGNDLIDAVDPDKLKQATCAMAVFAYQIGRSTVDLGRSTGATLSDDDH